MPRAEDTLFGEPCDALPCCCRAGLGAFPGAFQGRPEATVGPCALPPGKLAGLLAALDGLSVVPVGTAFARRRAQCGLPAVSQSYRGARAPQLILRVAHRDLGGGFVRGRGAAGYYLQREAGCEYERPRDGVGYYVNEHDATGRGLGRGATALGLTGPV